MPHTRARCARPLNKRRASSPGPGVDVGEPVPDYGGAVNYQQVVGTMLAVDQAMTQAPTEQQCNEQTAGETGCPYRMNVPVQRTNGWRSRVPLPDEREQRTFLP